MKQSIALLMFIIICSNILKAQSVPNAVIFNNSDYNLYFLGDSVTGKYYMSLDYDQVYRFKEGIAIVKKDGKIGGIDPSGKIVIPIEFDDINEFQNGYAVAERSGYQFLINKSGKPIGNETKYTNCTDMIDGMAMVKYNGKYGFIDVTGKEVIPAKYDDASAFSEGLAWVKLDTVNMFINKSGVRVGSDKYHAISDFSCGLAAVMVGSSYGYINKSGVLAIPASYSFATPFTIGIAKVQKKIDDKTLEGVIDKTGKEIIPCLYDWVVIRNDGFIEVKNFYSHYYESYDDEEEEEEYDIPETANKLALFGADGKQLTPFAYGEIGEFTDHFAYATKDGITLLINKSGKEISGPIKDVKILSRLALIMTSDDKVSIINNEGTVVSTHDFILSYPDSSFVVNDGGIVGADNNIQGGKCGLLSKTGTPLTEVKYDYIGVSKNGFHIMSMDKKCGLINRAGKEIVSPKYAVVDNYSDGLALVNDSAYYNEDYGWVGGHWGFVDQTGKESIPLIYESARPFSEGLALVEKNKEKFFIDKTGKEVLKLSYDDATAFNCGIAVVIKDYKVGAIDKSGNVVIPLIYDGYIDSHDKWHRFKQGSDVLVIDNTGALVKKL